MTQILISAAMSGLLIKKIRLVAFIALLLFILPGVYAQDNFRVMFYNVENLFDTKDNPEKNDDDFLPKGKQRWSNYRYWKKLRDLSRVIEAVGEGRPPAIVGLCEVESDSALFDFTKRSPLRQHKYEYIISDSEDERGINVALLYQRDEIKILMVNEYTPIFKDISPIKTRNILHVSGKIVNGDILDIFVCHFKSRNAGIKKSQPYRMQNAQFLKQKADSIMKIRPKTNLIIMGDFNDYPHDESMLKGMKASGINSNNPERNALYNMFYHQAKDKKQGSYKYRGKWLFPDQFIVNGNLLNTKNKTYIQAAEANVFSAEFLMEEDTKYGGKKPFRTYSGFKYLEGFSDHLPIYMDLIVKE